MQRLVGYDTVNNLYSYLCYCVYVIQIPVQRFSLVLNMALAVGDGHV